MTTIEMLKELVENGGMFETQTPDDWYITRDKSLGIVWLRKSGSSGYQMFEMSEGAIAATWKPYVKPVDWTKVPIDVKVKCGNRGDIELINAHYAGLNSCGLPLAWKDGKTSHTAHGGYKQYFEIMKLAE